MSKRVHVLHFMSQQENLKIWNEWLLIWDQYPVLWYNRALYILFAKHYSADPKRKKNQNNDNKNDLQTEW